MKKKKKTCLSSYPAVKLTMGLLGISVMVHPSSDGWGVLGVAGQPWMGGRGSCHGPMGDQV